MRNLVRVEALFVGFVLGIFKVILKVLDRNVLLLRRVISTCEVGYTQLTLYVDS